MAASYDKFVKTISQFSGAVYIHAKNSWNGIDLTKDEPDIIKNYLLSKNVGIDYLNKNLSPILSQSSYEVKFASVFVHKKPTVVRTAASIALCTGTRPSCELGDLLIVFCFLDANKKPIHCTALLSQAKKDSLLDNRSQQCLYESDVDFDMPATIYNFSEIKTPNRILPSYGHGRTNGLIYSIINPAPHSHYVPWNTDIVYDWGLTLERILIGDLGLKFGGPVVSPDWNCIIHDLIQVGEGTIKSSTKRGGPLDNVVDIFNDFSEYDNYKVDVQDREGISTIYIIVRDKETFSD